MIRECRRIAALLLIAFAASCGEDSGPNTPSAPRYSLTGIVSRTDTGLGLAGASVEVISGVNAGRVATTDAGGRYTLVDLQSGQFTLRASTAGHAPAVQPVTLSGNQTANIGLLPAQFLTSGRVINALTASGVGGVAIDGDGISALPTDPGGGFSIVGSDGIGDPRLSVFSAPGLIERRTHVRVPGPDAEVSVIPETFDLRAFNEMFRLTMLLRWADPPPLTIERRTLQFTSVGDLEFTANAEVLSDEEVAQLQGDLTWALPQLTGGRFGGFERVDVQQAADGSRVPFLTSGRITVARFAGLTAATGFWGYSRWQFRSDGVVVGGTIMLDRDFDRSGSAFRRSLRAHELGHSLGYNHVTARVSVMNSNARTEPNDFDRDAARIAFQRPPGNRAPDTDPDLYSTNRLRTTTWSVGAR